MADDCKPIFMARQQQQGGAAAEALNKSWAAFNVQGALRRAPFTLTSARSRQGPQRRVQDSRSDPQPGRQAHGVVRSQTSGELQGAVYLLPLMYERQLLAHGEVLNTCSLLPCAPQGHNCMVHAAATGKCGMVEQPQQPPGKAAAAMQQAITTSRAQFPLEPFPSGKERAAQLSIGVMVAIAEESALAKGRTPAVMQPVSSANREVAKCHAQARALLSNSNSTGAFNGNRICSLIRQQQDAHKSMDPSAFIVLVAWVIVMSMPQPPLQFHLN